MLISPDSQGEGTGQQLSPDKSSSSWELWELGLPFWPSTGDCINRLMGNVVGSAFCKESGGQARAQAPIPFSFFFFFFAFPCTISRVGHGDLEEDIEEWPPFNTQVWKRGHTNEEVAQSEGALGTSCHLESERLEWPTGSDLFNDLKVSRDTFRLGFGDR